jgi:hypothetical protein
LKENRFVVYGDPRPTRPNTINVRSDLSADLHTRAVGLEVKEPAMDHTGSYIDLLAIQAVSPTVRVGTAAS